METFVFYAPGTGGYVHCRREGNKYVAQWGGFDSSYQMYYFDNIEELIKNYIDREPSISIVYAEMERWVNDK